MILNFSHRSKIGIVVRVAFPMLALLLWTAMRISEIIYPIALRVTENCASYTIPGKHACIAHCIFLFHIYIEAAMATITIMMSQRSSFFFFQITPITIIRWKNWRDGAIFWTLVSRASAGHLLMQHQLVKCVENIIPWLKSRKPSP